jgi:hypothetical protein
MDHCAHTLCMFRLMYTRGQTLLIRTLAHCVCGQQDVSTIRVSADKDQATGPRDWPNVCMCVRTYVGAWSLKWFVHRRWRNNPNSPSSTPTHTLYSHSRSTLRKCSLPWNAWPQEARLPIPKSDQSLCDGWRVLIWKVHQGVAVCRMWKQ